jgi:hypothetical protein
VSFFSAALVSTKNGVDRERRGLDPDRDRVVQVALGERADLGRHRRAEERRLPSPGCERDDLLDVLEEAEVEHLVGLVEHHEAARVQHQRVARDQVEHAPDGPDDDLRAGLQLRLLGPDRRAAEDGDGVDPLVARVGAQRLRDLDAELARRRQHQRLRVRVGGVDEVDHRQPERGRLAGAGLGLADHVAAGEQVGDRLLLDRTRRLVADVAEGVQYFF